jgi:sugar lactone lactonase YvrE
MISDQPGHSIEGLVFDADGVLHCCHRYSIGEGDTKVTVSEVLALGADGEPSVVLVKEGASFNGLAFGGNGELFIADMTGRIWLKEAVSSELVELPSTYDDHQIMPNDVVLGATGDLYVADFSGNAMKSDAGIYRLLAAEDYQVVEEFQGNLHTCNGLAFSPDGAYLWVAETSMNRILRFSVAPDGSAKQDFLDACVVYQDRVLRAPILCV